MKFLGFPVWGFFIHQGAFFFLTKVADLSPFISFWGGITLVLFFGVWIASITDNVKE